MKNKRTMKHRRIRTNVMIIVVMVTMTISMLFSTPGIASQDIEDSTISSAERSSFFLKLIGSTVSPLKAEKNSDDKSFIGKFTVNALDIVNKEVSFFKMDTKSFQDGNAKETAQKIQEIVVNPFKINDGSINKVENAVNIVGDPKDNSKKKLLILHTHTNEAYAEGNTGLESTVAAVGDTLTEELEKLGFTVIHDKTVHDIVYDSAYYESRKTLTKYLESYGDFDLIIDLHRDSVPNKAAVTTTIEGTNVAKLMFVAAVLNPRFGVQNQIIDSLVGIANERYEGLFRTKYLYTYQEGIAYYSQDLSDNVVLLEVGANTNSLQEAKNSMIYMSKVIAEYLNTR